MLGLGQGEPAGDVGRDRRGFRRGAASAGEQLPGSALPVTDGVAVPAGACEGCQLCLGAQALGAELDADLRSLALARPSQTRLNGRVGVRPAALPQGELSQLGVVEAEHTVLAQGGARGLEVRSRGVELPAADLDRRRG